VKEYFAQVRRAGFDIGLSTGKLTKAMVEVLSQLPPEMPPSKEVVVEDGFLMACASSSTTRFQGVLSSQGSLRRDP
jgi:hypothetical protein